MAEKGDRPTLVGLISDTHGVLRPEAIDALKGSDLIVHAGDVGDREILARLSSIAPVVAIRGNVDTGRWAADLPETAVAVAGDVRLYMLHDVSELALDAKAAGFDVVVSGHSHQPGQQERNGVLYINPGSAGPRRFRLPITVARLNVKKTPLQAEFVRLDEKLSRLNEPPYRVGGSRQIEEGGDCRPAYSAGPTQKGRAVCDAPLALHVSWLRRIRRWNFER